MIAVCLWEGEEIASARKQVYETRKLWYMAPRREWRKSGGWEDGQDGQHTMHERAEEGVANKEAALK